MSIKIENVQVRGLSEIPETRRSFNSQNKGDSTYFSSTTSPEENMWSSYEDTSLGTKDLNLMKKLTVGGDSHAKMNRFIEVYLTLTLPRRVWVDFDTYRIGRDDIQPDDIEYFSDSTMHTLGKTKLEDIDTLFDEYTPTDSISIFALALQQYQQGQTEDLFMKMKSSLTEGFLQARRMKINYQALRHLYFDRKNHRQPEFKEFCKWIETLPYAKELILWKKPTVAELWDEWRDSDGNIFLKENVSAFRDFLIKKGL